jgi:hypothetical protein
MDVGEGHKRTRSINSSERRRGGVEWGEKRGHGNKSTPSSAHRNGPFRPTTAFQMPSVGVPASPWMWAKARSERGALIRLCGNGVVSNEARNGVIHFTRKQINQPLPLHTETDRSDPPPRFRCPPLAFPPRHGCGRRP